MDKDAEKRYQDLSPKEKYDSAKKADAAPWNPLTTAKDLIVEKLSPKKEDTKPTKPFKKGGKVKKMCGGGKMASGGKVRGCGCEIKGKTKGRMV